ncbi:MAG: tyrosine-type recombinase/integrase [Planctomycetaceae bacterium]|nr:tyrosine-type recombinase/integrase [Planctomycetaceae bacterium]
MAKKPNRIAFSKRNLEAVRPPASGRVYWYDERTPGLCLLATAAGAKVFYWYKWVAGEPQRVRIGPFPEVTVETARKRASRENGKVAEGGNPAAERRESREGMTVAELFAYWLESYAKPRKKTWKEDERLYTKFIEPRWADRRLSQIAEEDVEALHAEIGDENGRFQANRVLELVRAAFTRARKKLKWKGANPAEYVEAFPEESRDRFLQRSELPRFFKALEQEPALTRDFFLMLLFTGARRANVQAMRWDEIEGTVWRIPQTKSGKPIRLPLVPEAQVILETRRAAAGDSPWVFPTRRGSGSGHVQEPKRAWQNLIKRAGISDLRMHDLRRSLGSYAAETGASLPVIAKLLGHEAGSRATQVYARMQLGPAMEAATRATAEITAIVAAANRQETDQPEAKEVCEQ